MLKIQVSNRRERQDFEHASGPLEFGRGPERGGIARCVIQDAFVSRDHLRMEELSDRRLRVENQSQRNAVNLPNNTEIPPGQTVELAIPVRLTIGNTLIVVEAVGPDQYTPVFQTINQPLRARSAGAGGPVPTPISSLARLGSAPNLETLTQWFETVVAVQRAAAGSAEFYDYTARAVVELVGLDLGLVLLRQGESWETAARFGKPAPQSPEFSHTILRRIVEDRRTLYHAGGMPLSESLRNVQAVVASPVFDHCDQIVGAIYGSRTAKGAQIGPLEAQVVQLLASAVGVGLARLEKESEASRLRVQFDQFFSPNLSRELQRNPQLLEGQEREVTVLFADLRGFSRLAEQLTPHDFCRLVADVREKMTGHVREYDGVVVDYAGDGLMAMWNAPTDQPDHAAQACRAALAMTGDLPSLSAQWQDIVGGPLALGVGINTGNALVGNTGTHFKLKYGPIGHTVNLSSRVEGITKQLGIPVLITGNVRSLVGGLFATRRLGRARVVGIREPVEIYELYAEDAPAEWLARRDVYEKALSLYENGDWSAACQTIYPVLQTPDGRYDVPCLDLVARSVACLKSRPDPFDPVIELTGK